MLGKLIGHLLRRPGPRPAGAEFTDRETARLKTALALANEGRLPEAERIYRELLLVHPEHVDLLHLIGNAALARADVNEAIELLRRAAELEPHSAELNLHLGDAYAARGEVERAIAHFRRAGAANATLAPAWINLGHALRQSGEREAAAASYRRALELRPDGAEIYVSLAAVLRELGRCDEALDACTRAIELTPDSPDAHVNLGHALRDLGRAEESIAAYRRAVELRPDAPEAHLHLGNALFLDGHNLDEAAREFTRALELNAGFDEARFNLALTRLARGDYAGGWSDYELRRLNPDWPRRPFEYTQWTGGELDRKKLLVYSEQGLGDEIMFASCVPDLITRGAQCVIECSPKLTKLFQRSFPAATVYPVNAERTVPADAQRSGIDMETPIGSLPGYFRRARTDFPQHGGYLKADADSVAAWRSRLNALGPGLKVGISWQGGTQKSRRLARSLSLERMLPILTAAQAHFVDLQYTDCSDELAALQSTHGVRVHSWDAVRTDYDETAALVSALDLVISVCTAVIHLGGALGRPVWVMVPYGCEWRYGFTGEDMPWYPSVRLLRQARSGDWDPVIDNVARSLRDRVQANMPS